MNYMFTVLTPTYMRVDKLHRVYESLIQQTFTDFEWVVVDNGSVDGTRELVTKWAKSAPFSIRYFWQENQHKYYSLHRGIQLSKGEFVLIADSDDTFPADSLQIFSDEYEVIPESKKAEFSGVVGLCENQHGKQMGDLFPNSPFDSDELELKFIHKLFGERWGAIKLEVLKKLFFDETLFNKGLIPENILWYQIPLLGYKTRFVNRIVRTYFFEEEDDHKLTDIEGTLSGSFGIMHMKRYELNHLFQKYFPKQPLFFIKALIKYTTASLEVREPFRDQIGKLDLGLVKFLFLLTYPAGYIYRKRLKSMEKKLKRLAHVPIPFIPSSPL